MIIINYQKKGGVGKTTGLMQLAERLAQNGQRVVMVDADPQVNLTTRAFKLNPVVNRAPSNPEQEVEAEEEEDDDADDGPVILNNNRMRTTRNTEVAMREMMSAPYGDVMQKHPTMIQMNTVRNSSSEDDSVTNVYDLAMHYMHNNKPCEIKPAKVARYKNMFIVPGSSRLYTLDASMQLNIGDDADVSIKRKLTAFRRMLQDAGTAVGATYVLVDVGPSPCNINKYLVMSADFLQPFGKADLFTTAGHMDLMGSLLPQWMAHAQQIKRVLDEASMPTLLFPRILPMLVSMFPMTTRKVKGKVEEKMNGSEEAFLVTMHRIAYELMEMTMVEKKDDDRYAWASEDMEDDEVIYKGLRKTDYEAWDSWLSARLPASVYKHWAKYMKNVLKMCMFDTYSTVFEDTDGEEVPRVLAGCAVPAVPYLQFMNVAETLNGCQFNSMLKLDDETFAIVASNFFDIKTKSQWRSRDKMIKGMKAEAECVEKTYNDLVDRYVSLREWWLTTLPPPKQSPKKRGTQHPSSSPKKPRVAADV